MLGAKLDLRKCSLSTKHFDDDDLVVNLLGKCNASEIWSQISF